MPTIRFKTAALAVASLPSAVLGGSVGDVIFVPMPKPQPSCLLLEGGGYLLLENRCKILLEGGGGVMPPLTLLP